MVDCLLWGEGGTRDLQSIDEQTVWGSIRGNAGAVPDHCGEERAETQGEALFFNQSVYVPTVTHGPELWIVTKGQGYGYKWLK